MVLIVRPWSYFPLLLTLICDLGCWDFKDVWNRWGWVRVEEELVERLGFLQRN